MQMKRTHIAEAFVAQADAVGTKTAVKELAALLLEQRMHNQVEELLLEIAAEYKRKHGFVEAAVRTPYALSSELKKQLSALVASSTGAKKVLLNEELDPTLLAGMVLSAPDMELDLSLKTKLEKLKA